MLLQTSRGSKRSADALDVLLQGDLQDDRDTSDDAKRAKCLDSRLLSHEEKLERRCAGLTHAQMASNLSHPSQGALTALMTCPAFSLQMNTVQLNESAWHHVRCMQRVHVP